MLHYHGHAIDLTSDESISWTSIRTPDDFVRNIQRGLFGFFRLFFFEKKLAYLDWRR